MKVVKKILAACTAGLLIGAMSLSIAGCSGNSSDWIAKNNNATIPTGVYNYYLYASYASAYQTVEDFSLSVFDQQIEGKDGEVWIKEKALEQVKAMLLVEDLMKEYNLKLSDTERLQAQNQADGQWKDYQAMFEPYGVDKDSFKMAFADYNSKFTKVFQYEYSHGDKAISDADLKDYFEKNYTAFRYVLASTYDSSSNNYASVPDDQLEALKKQFNGYVDGIKAGTITLEKAAEELAAANKTNAEDELQTRAVNFNKSNDYPQELVDALAEMTVGEVRMVEADGYIIAVVKDDPIQKSAEQISTEDGKLPIQIDMKGDEYTADMNEKTAKYTNYTLNDEAYNKSVRDLFEPAADTSSTTSSHVTDAPVSSTAGSSAPAPESSQAPASSAAAGSAPASTPTSSTQG